MVDGKQLKAAHKAEGNLLKKPLKAKEIKPTELTRALCIKCASKVQNIEALGSDLEAASKAWSFSV